MAELTPAMKQYAQIRSSITDPNTILFFRMGDFYEMFYDDALTASKILEIALTARNRNDPNPVPLCGVPYHAAQTYIDRLLASGKKVAICEQVEDPKMAKGVVRREITQVITPAVTFASETTGTRSRYLVALIRREGRWGMAAADASTGELLVTQVEGVLELLQEIVRKDPQEILLPEEWRGDSLVQPLIASLHSYAVTYFACPNDPSEEMERLSGMEAALSEAPSGCEAGKLLWSYLQYTHREASLSHFTRVGLEIPSMYVRLDSATIQHLELTRSRDSDGATLTRALDRTVTPMGARRLKNWILHPLRSIPAIQERQRMLAAVLEDTTVHLRVRAILEGTSDMERIVGRVATGFANARDLAALALTLRRLPDLISLLKPLPELSAITQILHPIPELATQILETLVEEPPLSVKDGGLIRAGVNDELDELRGIRGSGKQFIAALEEQERQRTGISSLKIGYNRVFGYYLEVTHAHRDKIPDNYIRKQTLTNAERYITPELKTYEEKVLGAEERITQLEYALFVGLREAVLPHMETLQATADAVGTLDTIQGLALLAREERYVCPKLVVESLLDIREGRHPVIEQVNRGERFVPNDLALRDDQFLAIITGPNMAGKSTVMRQTALITLMAHMGSFVPAKSATIGIVDQILTRVGASDNLAQGQSTFMVEMTETAAILARASSQSLIIIDEIGRGTSTFDGVSIAWAVAEFLHDMVRARCLFATHYHELTDLALTKPHVCNMTIAVKEWNGEIIFLRKLIPGGASRSYGIQVARLAGLPTAVIDRAKEILNNLERGELNDIGMPRLAQGQKGEGVAPQMQLFTTRNEVQDTLKTLSVDTLTPIEALNILFDLKRKL